MTWTSSFIALMREQGREPFGCLVEGCPHISKSTFGMVVHDRFGSHN